MCARAVISLLILTFLLTPIALAQVDPGVDQGVGIGDSTLVYGVDQVRLATGNVYVHIPLISYPQRGKLSLSFSLLGNTVDWVATTKCTKTTCTNSWVSSGQNGVHLVDDQILKYVIGSIHSTHATGLFDATEAAHPLVFTSYDGQCAYHSETSDATGFMYVDDGCNGSYVVDRAGIRHYREAWIGTTSGLFGNQSSYREDPNGNVIYHYQSGSTCPSAPCSFYYQDTLGRNIPSPFYAEQTSYTSDYSGCTGPLPIDSAVIWNAPGPNGGVTSLKFCYVQILGGGTDFGISSVPEGGTGAFGLQSVVLPSGGTWTFEYNSVDSKGNNWGNLSKITFPTGGSISYAYTTYVWGGTTIGGDPGWQGRRLVSARTVDANDGTGPHTWHYNWSPAYVTGTVASTPPTQVVVTDPMGNDNVYTMQLYGDHVNRVSGVQEYQGPYKSGTLLLTQTTDWATIGTLPPPGLPSILPIRRTTTWANGKTKKVERDYDTAINWITFGTNGQILPAGTGTYGNVIAERYYDYGTGSPSASPLRTSTFNYAALTNSSYSTNNLLDLLGSVTVTNGNGYQCAQVSFTYDAPGRLLSSGITTQHNAPFAGGVRGNISSATNQLSATPCQSGSSWTPVTAYSTYFDTGMRAADQDPLGRITSYVYSPRYFAGAYLTQINLPDTNSPNLAHHQINQNYDLNTGLITSYTEQNGNKTSYSYDSMWRLTSAVFPPQPEGTAQTNFYYPNSNTVEKTQRIDSTRSTDEFTHFDGLGRVTRRILANDESTPWDQVDFCYDGRGQLAFMSYPYQGTGLSATQSCTGLGDTFSRDAIGRISKILHSDGSAVQKTYSGPTMQISDEGNGTRVMQRQIQVDGLGRLTSTCEISNAVLLGPGGAPTTCGQDIASTGFLTTYTYDGLGNLLSSSQNGYLNRGFQYDSFSRLLSASNPESGTKTYTYDNAGRIKTVTNPRPNQTNGALTVTATLTYDALDRMLTKTFSDGTTPGVTVNYDETTALGVTGLTNTIGRGSSAYVTNSQSQMLAGEIVSYDARGNIRSNSQCTPQNCGSSIFPVNYTFDLLHNILTSTNGLGVTLTSSYNRAERLTSLASSLFDATHPGTLVSAAHYNAFGDETTASLGNSELEKFGYSPRGLLTSLAVGPGAPNGQTYSFSVGLAPDGDVVSATDSVNGNWAYAYDDFNRLTCANLNNGTCVAPSSGTATYTYAYDRFGNRWNQSGTHAVNLTFTGGNNRIDGYSYDAAGNLLNDGTHSYTYDAENRIIQVDGGSTASYVYDASGRRVRQTTALGTVDNIYDIAGRKTSEVSSTGTWVTGEVYAAGRHLATYASGNTLFNHADWLATNRVHTNAAGAVIETCSNLPFGDQMTCTGSEVSSLHLTGQEHDMETGLDHFQARYYSGQFGRWTIPDWGYAAIPYASLSNPQSLNLYAFVQNNPITNVDGSGHAQSADEIRDELSGFGGANDFENESEQLGQVLAQLPKSAGQCDSFFCKVGDWFRNVFGGENPEPPADDARWRFHPTSPGLESIIHQADETARPLRETMPKEVSIDVNTGIPGISVSASTDTEASVEVPEIKDSTHLKKWSSPKVSVTLKWNPPPKEENLGEVHANYWVASAGTNITPEGPKGFNLGAGPKAELPVGGSVSQEGLKSLWNLVVDGAKKLLPTLVVYSPSIP